MNVTNETLNSQEAVALRVAATQKSIEAGAQPDKTLQDFKMLWLEYGLVEDQYLTADAIKLKRDFWSTVALVTTSINPYLREAVRLAEELLATNKGGDKVYLPLSEQERAGKALHHLGSYLLGKTDEDHYARAMTNLMLGAEARRQRLEGNG